MVNIKKTVNGKKQLVMSYITWGLVIVLIISNIFARLNIQGSLYSYDIFFTALTVFAWVHGIPRYGVKKMLVWFVITWIVSLSFEALSIRTGFPFGHYHYTNQEFAILGVPSDIMGAYFAIAYTSWTVTQALTGMFNKNIMGVQKFIMPFTTSLVMCMFDLVTDPKDANINKSWIWENGGEYFGVPILNFFGWVLTVYVFMQIFTLFIANKNPEKSDNNIASKKSFWLQAGIVFLSCGLGIVLEGFTQTEHIEMYRTMGLISVFTVVFVSYIALLNTINSKELTGL